MALLDADLFDTFRLSAEAMLHLYRDIFDLVEGQGIALPPDCNALRAVELLAESHSLLKVRLDGARRRIEDLRGQESQS